MENNEQSIKELIDSLTSSIEDIHNHPTTVDKIPSNLEILVSGINGINGL